MNLLHVTGSWGARGFLKAWLLSTVFNALTVAILAFAAVLGGLLAARVLGVL